MEDNYQGCSRHQTDVYGDRFIITVIAILIFMMTIIELAVALDAKFTRTLVPWAMWAGSLLWMITTIMGWVEKSKNINNRNPLWLMVFLTIVAIGSVAGIYIPILTAFALWANAVLFVFFLCVIILLFPQTWKVFGILQEEK